VFSDWSFLVYFGLLLKVSGFLIRDELLLRTLVGGGLLCDVVFFLLQDPPIWSSASAGSVLVAINVVVCLIILAERTTLNMTRREKRLFEALGTMTPGQFRRLMRNADKNEATERVQLATEGAHLRHLFFVEGDTFYLEKEGQIATGQGPAFIGEIAFLRNTPASATVFVEPGTQYIGWPISQLTTSLDKSPPLRNAFMTAVARDLSIKVASSLPVQGCLDKASE
jgi:hypothetical protein